MAEITTKRLKEGHTGSFLVDSELKDVLDRIFQGGSYDASAIRHASYQLRLGSTVRISPYKTTGGERLDQFMDAQWVTTEANGPFVEIQPRQTALLYTEERFHFPPDMLGFVFCRGLLFTRALNPENTYVDPGYDGALYITVRNESDHIVRLKKGMHLARLFVFRLFTSVSQSYVSGESLGIDQQLSQIPARDFWPPHALPRLPDADLMSAIRAGCRVGDLLEQIVKRQERTRVRTQWWLVGLTAVLAVFVLWTPVIVPLSKWSWLRQHIGEEVGRALGVGVTALLSLCVMWIIRKLTPVLSALRSR